MPPFFRQAGDSSDSEDEYSSEEELMSSGDEAPKPATSMPAMSRLIRGADDPGSSDEAESESEAESDTSTDEEEENLKRVVKSARDKRLGEMAASGKIINNALRINNWVAIPNEFAKLHRMTQRHQNVWEPVLPLFIRTLVNLESSLNAAVSKEKQAKKKMDASNARALTAMKQRVKKITKEFEAEVKMFHEGPEAFEHEYAAVATVEAPTASEAEQFTPECIYKNLQAVQEARGKKNTDRSEQIRILEKLLEVSVTTYQRIRVLLALLSSRFDYNSSIATYMPIELWIAARKELDQLVGIIIKDPRYSIQETIDDYEDLVERSPETEPGGIVVIRGSITGFVDRLDDEFTKSLQHIDPHGTQYVDRLKDETSLYCTICRAQALYETTKQDVPLGCVLVRRLEHIYSKPDAVVQALEAAVSASDLKLSIFLSNTVTKDLIHRLCVPLYKSGNSLLRSRAMLCHIYHYALHNDFHTARDMLLVSHLQESIHSSDVATQILYNRTVVQLGLSAFRCGLIKESQAILQDIFATQRVQELLAQGVHTQRYHALTPEQERAERLRQLPFHTHINTELLEAVFLASNMLVEIPLLASIDNEEQNRKTISKTFRRLLNSADRQAFIGPPESTRDHIMQASWALQDGEWEKCRDLILSIKIWSLMPEASSVKEMLVKCIQKEGLRTYLFTHAQYLNTLSLSLLSWTFSLPLCAVTSIVSEMMWNEELSASLDQQACAVVFHRIDISRAQQLAQVLTNKVNALVEQTEKTLDQKLGHVTSRNDRQDGVKGDKREQTAERRRGAEPRAGGCSGAHGGRGARFAQGLGNQMASA